jgi:23S rRNA (pseudouridine1915-N3)-methyltransferase
MPGWVAEGFADYAKRLPRDYPLDLVELKPEPRDRGRSVERILAAEATRIRAACDGFRVVALDERGKTWTTRDLAEHLSRWRDEAIDVAFVIGSADGLDANVKRGAHDVVSLSSFTLPHALARVMLAEQLYRAASLLSGHPYHRE